MKNIILIAVLTCSSLFNFVESQQTMFGYIENKGQVVDQQNSPNDSVLFLFSSNSNYNLHLYKTGFSYDFYKVAMDTIYFESGFDTIQQNKVLTHRIDFNLLDVNENCSIQALFPANDYLNFIQNFDTLRTIESVKHYNSVKYQNIYPNIDLYFKQNNGKIKYDFILNPGADISSIKFKISAYDAINFSDSLLNFTYSIGNSSEIIPNSFYVSDTSNVLIKYQLIDSTVNHYVVGFSYADLSQIQLNDTLIIDPEPDLNWGKYFSANLYTSNSSVITNKNGEVFTAGSMMNLFSFASKNDSISELKNKVSDAFVSKISKKGELIWTTFYSSKGLDLGENVQVDTMLNCYFLGTQLSDSNGLIQKRVFINKLSEDGTRIYTKLFTSEINESGIEGIVAFDGSLFTSSSFDTIIQADTLSGIKLRSLSENGLINWERAIKGNNNEKASGISLGNNHITVIGNTNSDLNLASVNSFKDSLSGANDGLLASYDLAGNQLWLTYIGGDSIDKVNDIKAFNDNIFIVGKTNSNLPYMIEFVSFQDTLAGGFDGFISCFSSTGTHKWSSYLGGMNNDEAVGISRELDSNIFVLSKTFSIDSTLATIDVHQNQQAGQSDCLISKFTPDGLRMWSTFYGGEQIEKPRAIHVFGNTSIYVCGTTNSSTKMVDTSNLVGFSSFYGNEDGFLAKLTQNNSTLGGNGSGSGGSGGGSDGGGGGGGESCYTGNSNQVSYCVGDTLHLTYPYGDLGTDAQWVWYLNACGEDAPQIGVGETLTYILTESVSIYIRAESISNSTPCENQHFLVYNRPVANILSDSIFCLGNTESIESTNQTHYYWYKNEQLIDTNQIINLVGDSLSNGAYQLKVVNEYACWDTASIQVNFNPIPSYSFVSQEETCEGMQNAFILFTVTDSTTIVSELNENLGNNLIFDSLIAGTYIFQIKGQNQCYHLDTIQIQSNERIQFDTLVTFPRCGFYDGKIELIPENQDVTMSYIWDTFTDTLSFIDSLKAGNYHVTTSDSNNCIYEFNINLTGIDSLRFNLTPYDTLVNLGDTIVFQLIPSFNDTTVNYLWSPLENDSCINCLNKTVVITSDLNLTVWASTIDGCYGMNTAAIHVILPDSTSKDTLIPCIDLFLPSHFSPNSDGNNDVWCLIGNCVLSGEIKIFNQWNELIYYESGSDLCWDGTYKGSSVPNDLYYYILTVETSNQGQIQLNGYLTVQK